MKKLYAVLVILAMSEVAAFASGAPWYRWINVSDRTVICAQNSPGDGWVSYKGPYMESRCVKPGNPE